MRTNRNEETEVLERVRRLRARLETQLEEKGTDKPSVAEYLRLLQLERELEEAAPKDITVQWVDTLDSEETVG